MNERSGYGIKPFKGKRENRLNFNYEKVIHLASDLVSAADLLTDSKFLRHEVKLCFGGAY